jgi:hypothetical protein
MRCGGRCGDLTGYPTDWVVPDSLRLFTDRARPNFTPLGDIRVGSTYVFYVNDALITNAAISGTTYNIGIKKNSFAIAAVAPGVQDGFYDPLFSDIENEFSGLVILTALLAGTIAARASAILTGDVVIVALTAPLDVLSRNGGNANLEMQWSPPAAGVVDHYDVYIATALAGPYVKANSFALTEKRAMIRNIPFGTTVFSKVKAIDAAGNEGPFSAVANDAIAGLASVNLQFTGPVGDIIPTGTLFVAFVKGQLLAVKVRAPGGTIV